MKLLAAIQKEALILRRDVAGLVVLLVMPVVLVMVVTLVQEDTFGKALGTGTRLLLLDLDDSPESIALGDGLREESDFFDVTRVTADGAMDEEAAQRAVAAGEYRVCLVVPPGFFDTVHAGATALIGTALDGPAEGEGSSHDDADAAPPAITVYLDPAVCPSHRRAIITPLHQVLQAMEMKSIIRAIESEMALETEDREDAMGWEPGELAGLREVRAGGSPTVPMATSVQQNVPAWALFGMFMTVIPLSAAIIKERDFGTLVRLRTLPVSLWTLVLAKVAVYASVCMLQFGLMLCLGLFVFPLLGPPALDMGVHYGLIALVAVSAALAATGFGMLIGSIARTHDQASVFGATSVVIAAAFGGIMVPVFLMPRGMQLASRFSPLNWGLNAFLEVFVRGASLAAVMPDVWRLLGFFAVSMCLAVFCFRSRD